MDRIDEAQARDHIEMIDRILAESQPRLRGGGEFFVIWGIAGAYITILFQLVNEGVVGIAALLSVPVVIAGCTVYSIVRGRAQRSAVVRTSLVQREFFNVLWLTLGLGVVVNVAAFRIFPGIAGAAIWSVAQAIVLLYIGMHGNRRAQIAGILVIASLVVANFGAPSLSAYVLAAGMLAGYTGFGVSELLSHD